MTKKILVRDADLRNYPEVISYQVEHTHVSLGDLHGNALKLIYTLIEEGILLITAQNYNKLRDIYFKETENLDLDDLMSFRTIIRNSDVNTSRSLTLLGDELADRGNNDYFTLIVLKKLVEANLDIDIILSNHSAEFIRDYEQNAAFTGKCQINDQQSCSLSNMKKLISRYFINEEELRELIKDCYKPIVKAIGYTLSPEGNVTLFSHAPIGLETIESLATKCNIEYCDETPKELINTINCINEALYSFFAVKALTDWINKENQIGDDYFIPVNQPFRRLIWNRALGDELRTTPRGSFNVYFVHGHVGEHEIFHNNAPLSTHQNLDNYFGKSEKYSETGVFSSLYDEPAIQVRHFTLQSSEITARQLMKCKNNTLSDIAAITQRYHDRLYMPCLIKILYGVDKKAYEILQNNFQNTPLKNQHTIIENKLFQLVMGHHKGEVTTEDLKSGLDKLAIELNSLQFNIEKHLKLEKAVYGLKCNNEKLQVLAEHNSKKYQVAGEKLKSLILRVKSIFRMYYAGQINAETFKTSCKDWIKVAEREFEKPGMHLIPAIWNIKMAFAEFGIDRSAVRSAAMQNNEVSGRFFAKSGSEFVENRKPVQQGGEVASGSIVEEPEEKPDAHAIALLGRQFEV